MSNYDRPYCSKCEEFCEQYAQTCPYCDSDTHLADASLEMADRAYEKEKDTWYDSAGNITD